MKCKRLSAAILSLVMIISLLPTMALAAEENDVWSTPYDEIRVTITLKVGQGKSVSSAPNIPLKMALEIKCGYVAF